MLANIKNIFCPVDIQNEAAEKLFLPLTLAQSFGAKLTFCFVAAKAGLAAFPPDDGKRNLKNFVETAREFSPHDANKFLPEQELIVLEMEDDTAEKIVDATANSEADLIVMRAACRPPRRLARLGSVAEKILHRAPCSVLIDSQTQEQLSGNYAAPVFRRILAAHDFSDYSEIALQYAFRLAGKYRSQIDLLHVLDQPSPDNAKLAWANETAERIYYQAVNRLQIAAKSDGEYDLKKVSAAARWGKPYREILNYAEKNEIDLIAMSERGVDFGAKSLFGSNADRVLRQAECAVLIARPIKRVCSETLRKFPQKAA